MSLVEEVLAQHRVCNCVDGPHCDFCDQIKFSHWPCETVRLATELQNADEAADTLLPRELDARLLENVLLLRADLTAAQEQAATERKQRDYYEKWLGAEIEQKENYLASLDPDAGPYVPWEQHRALAERLEKAEAAIRANGKCPICHGDGKPHCVMCHDYQSCRCGPNDGKNLPHCWSCKGSGFQDWARTALVSTPQEVANGHEAGNGARNDSEMHSDGC